MGACEVMRVAEAAMVEWVAFQWQLLKDLEMIRLNSPKGWYPTSLFPCGGLTLILGSSCPLFCCRLTSSLNESDVLLIVGILGADSYSWASYSLWVGCSFIGPIILVHVGCRIVVNRGLEGRSVVSSPIVLYKSFPNDCYIFCPVF